MQGFALLVFAAFALVLAGTYLSIRREWFKPGITAGVSIVLCMILMTMVSFAQGNLAIQAIIVGILVGGLFSSATLAVAWYFHRNELHARYRAEQEHNSTG